MHNLGLPSPVSTTCHSWSSPYWSALLDKGRGGEGFAVACGQPQGLPS
jgi:hypothetical protein